MDRQLVKIISLYFSVHILFLDKPVYNFKQQNMQDFTIGRAYKVNFQKMKQRGVKNLSKPTKCDNGDILSKQTLP